MSHLLVRIKKAAKVIHEGGGTFKLGFEVGLVHKRGVKSEFMCVCTKVRHLVCVYW